MQNVSKFLRVYGLNKQTKGFLKTVHGFVAEEVFDSLNTLSFSLKETKLMNEMEIVYRDHRYKVTEIVDGRDDNGKPIYDVLAESVVVELGERNIESINFIAIVPQEGLEKLVKSPGWEIDYVEVLDELKHSMSEKNRSVLWLIRQWAKITGHEVKFDTVNRKISFLKRVGQDKGIGFRYRKNIKGIKRTMISPQATVIFPIGRGGLTIGEVNDDQTFLEDYSWYTKMGVELADAKKQYRKEYVWEDNRFILPGALKRAAEEKLSVLSQPQISYEIRAIDAPTLSENAMDINEYETGDFVTIIDDDLGINVLTRILRKKIYPDEPWRNEFEFNYLLPGLSDMEDEPLSSSDMSVAKEATLFFSNESPQKAITTTTNVGSLSLTSYAPTNGQVGFFLSGVASETLELTIYFTYQGERIGPEIKQMCGAGFTSIGVPFLIRQIPQGSGFIDIYMVTSKGTFDIAAGSLQMYLYASNLLGGISSSLPRANIQEEVSFPDLRLYAPRVVQQTSAEILEVLHGSMTQQIIFDELIPIAAQSFINIEGAGTPAPTEPSPTADILLLSNNHLGEKASGFKSTLESYGYTVDLQALALTTREEDWSDYSLIISLNHGNLTYLAEVGQRLRELSNLGVPILFAYVAPLATTHSEARSFGLINEFNMKNVNASKVKSMHPITAAYTVGDDLQLTETPDQVIHIENDSGFAGQSLLEVETPPISKTLDDFESDFRSFAFTGDWELSTARAAAGTRSLASKRLGHSTTAKCTVTFDVIKEGAELRFDWLVSSEPNYDWFEAYVDGTRVIRQSGQTSWAKYTHPLPIGSHSVEFRYSKDGSQDRNDDRAYIDNFEVYQPGFVDPTEPTYGTTFIVADIGDLDIEGVALQSKVSLFGFNNLAAPKTSAGHQLLKNVIKWLRNEG